MAEVVMTNKSTVRMNGTKATAEERAEYLVKNGYPVEEEDMDALIEKIQKQIDVELAQEKEFKELAQEKEIKQTLLETNK